MWAELINTAVQCTSIYMYASMHESNGAKMEIEVNEIETEKINRTINKTHTHTHTNTLRHTPTKRHFLPLPNDFSQDRNISRKQRTISFALFAFSDCCNALVLSCHRTSHHHRTNNLSQHSVHSVYTYTSYTYVEYILYHVHNTRTLRMCVEIYIHISHELYWRMWHKRVPTYRHRTNRANTHRERERETRNQWICRIKAVVSFFFFRVCMHV